ncbi:hypothetical protein TcasGA2_TC015267 [Tribolium castaneum]|uniref:Uncharacterized protein n=1 Tax=Tribolium castaneum TaxID=7070 RepID=D2A513_TRICA|nr:hypothetical protein TcasGA2_TC015267 [Tribolium castaneum]
MKVPVLIVLALVGLSSAKYEGSTILIIVLKINAYLAQLAKDYPETVTLETIGQSYEKHSPTTIRSILTASPLSRQLIPFIGMCLSRRIIGTTINPEYPEILWISFPDQAGLGN